VMKDTITREKLFGQLDFKRIATDPDFKEDSVREVIILAIIKELGYTLCEKVSQNKNPVTTQRAATGFTKPTNQPPPPGHRLCPLTSLCHGDE